MRPSLTSPSLPSTRSRPSSRPSAYGVRASDERGQQQRAATQQQREADERRHEESMTALKALIASRQTAAPETVTERTTPTDDGAGTKGA